MSKISFEGYNENCLTFNKAEGSAIKKGDFVSLAGNGTVTTAVANSDIIGYCTDVDGDYVTVQTQGYIKATLGSGDSVALGYTSLTTDANQKIINSSTARKVLVVDVDIPGKTIGFIL
ncbi:MAG: hypothetical protein IKA56_01245 [Clostridia bacterium]|nr:hypothetical protein [Clostridia bacterium]